MNTLFYIAASIVSYLLFRKTKDIGFIAFTYIAAFMAIVRLWEKHLSHKFLSPTQIVTSDLAVTVINQVALVSVVVILVLGFTRSKK